MRGIRVIPIVLLLLLISIISPLEMGDSVDKPIGQDSQELIEADLTSEDVNVDDTGLHGTRTPLPTASTSGNKLLENNNHGGSWLDSFEDDSGIDWGQSKQIDQYKGNVRINLDELPKTVAYWKLDEGSGQYAYDESANKNDGVLGGSTSSTTSDPTWTTGKFGSALNFDGNNDYVRVSHSSSLDITGVVSFEAWIKAKGTANYHCIVDKYRHVATNNDQGYSFYLGAGRLRLVIYSGATFRDCGGTSDLRDDKWHYVVGVYDGTNIAVYVDGAREKLLSHNQGPKSNTYNLGIGRRLSGWGGYLNFNGKIDDVKILTVALTAQEVKERYVNGSQSNFTNGTLISQPINLPKARVWDSLIIDKTMFNNTWLNFTILNASTLQQLPGSSTYTTSGEFDISNIDAAKYPSIRLRANFTGNGSNTPELNYWGVSWNATNAWRDTLFGGLKESSVNLTSGEGEIWLNTTFTNFIKYSGNPIVKKGTGSSWDNTHVNRAFVLYNGTGYMMWYGGTDASKLQIGFATSSDGISWTKYSGNPVLTISSSGWDSRHVTSPFVLYDGKTYKMWYQGQDASTDWQIGYATSTDGINWNKYSNNPVLKIGSSGWDSHYVTNPNIYYDGSQYKMWFTGLGDIGGGNVPYQIGYATSIDGINWDKYLNNPIITASGFYTGVGHLSVHYEKGKYYGYYGRKFSSTNHEIYHATSVDGINWVNYPNNPVLTKGSSGSWDDNFVLTPRIFFNDNQYFLYHAGNDGSNSQIGLARSKFNTSGNLTSEPINLLAANQHRILLVNKTEPTNTFINVSILDATTDNPIPGFVDLRGKIINISSISRSTYPIIKLKAKFESNGLNTPILYDWSIGPNSKPKIIDVISPLIVNRTHTIQININITDGEEQEKDLKLVVKYKAPSDINWQTAYLGTLGYNTDRWTCPFTPPAIAELGQYSFRFVSEDSLNETYIYPSLYNIEVVNNAPVIWSITTSPAATSVNRTKTVKLVMDVSDVETADTSLEMTVLYKSPLDSTWQSGYIANKIYSSGYWEADFTPAINADLGLYDFKISCNDSITNVTSGFNLLVINTAPIIWNINNTPTGISVYRTNTVRLIMNATDLETIGNKLSFVVKYKSPLDTNWQINYLSNLKFSAPNWTIDFTPPKNADLGIYSFNIMCNDTDSGSAASIYNLEVLNNIPVISQISTNTPTPKANRTVTIKLIITTTDIETAAKDLIVNVSYNTPIDSSWQYDYISNLKFSNGNWELDFTPSIDAPLGQYTFNVSSNDTEGGIVDIKYNVLVVNNYPIVHNILTDTSEHKVNRTDTLKLIIDSSDVEVLEKNLVVEIRYKSPRDFNWQFDYLSGFMFSNDNWEIDFTPLKNADLGDYIFRIKINDTDNEIYEEIKIEVVNNLPIIWAVNHDAADASVLRTDSVNIILDTSDVEVLTRDIDVKIRYKSPTDLTWMDDYISNLMYFNGKWEADFTPDKTAVLGTYTINLTSNDTDDEVFKLIEIDVLNNIPLQPEIDIIPMEPTTIDDLKIHLKESKDIETSSNDMEHWYRWYKDSVYQSELDNETTIPNSETLKDELWYVEVFPFDGDDFGPSAEAEVTIVNSPPIVVEPFYKFEMFEDLPVALPNKLSTVFADYDLDELTFEVDGNQNVDIDIFPQNGTILFTPANNWFGEELVTFYAYDTSVIPAETTASIVVKPTNDLPRITKVGNQLITEDYPDLEFIVSEDEWLNLTIDVEDIDGDVERGLIMYLFNITEQENLYFSDAENTLVFHPGDAEVGWHYINLRVTDNNETPTIFISQNFKIQVLNVNDPPTIKIKTPNDNQEFAADEKITLSCAADDIDTIISSNGEELIIRWLTNKSAYEELGTDPDLTNITLLPGYYNITVEVEDKSGARATDSIEIQVKEPPEKPHEPTSEPRELFTSNSIWLWFLIIVIVILVVIIALFFFTKQKKKRESKPVSLVPGHVLQPTDAYRPGGMPITPTSAQIGTAPIVAQSQQFQTRPVVEQLPSGYYSPSISPQAIQETRAYEQRTGVDSELTPQQKLALLDERLLRGEIDQDLYENLKAKYEFEAKPTQPPPQLPPASSPPVPPPQPAPTYKSTPAPPPFSNQPPTQQKFTPRPLTTQYPIKQPPRPSQQPTSQPFQQQTPPPKPPGQQPGQNKKSSS
jgi:predicted GH43/DUF377 family glycosyl hydrolase